LSQKRSQAGIVALTFRVYFKWRLIPSIKQLSSKMHRVPEVDKSKGMPARST